MMEVPRTMFIDIPPKNRSVSPFSLSPSRDSNLNFFGRLSRRFSGRSNDELSSQHSDEYSRCSSTDSCSSNSGRCNESIQHSITDLNSSSDSSSTSDNSADTSTKNHRFSIRKALQNLSISSRSLSCSSAPTDTQRTKKNKKSQPPKRILRQPVSYTYLKGMSGLPTQRVPRSSMCSYYSNQ